MARAGAGRNQESGTRNLIHVYHENNRIPSIWITFYCFPRHVSRRLDQKCRSQDLNQYSNRVLKLQMAASPAMSDSKSVCPDGLTFLLSLFSFKSENKKKKFLHYISRSDRWHFLIWKSLYPLHFGRAGLLRIIILIVKCFLCFNIIVSFDLQYFLLKKNSFWDLFWLLCYKISHFPLAALKFFPMLTLNFWKYCDQCSSDIINL